MEKFTIYFPLDSYIKGNNKLDTFGEFHIELGEYAFPDKSWTDFGRDVVLMWLNNVSEILNGEVKSAECSFMDGPFHISFQEKTKETWKISLVRRWFDGKEDGETIEKEAEVNSLEIVNEIFGATISRISLDKNRGEKYKDLNDSLIENFEAAKQNYFQDN